MAKDGTLRGGRRTRAGAKPKELAEKVADGDVLEALRIPDIEGTELTGEEMPAPSAYLSSSQRDGKPLGADLIYQEVWCWLKARGCERLVQKHLLESYAMSMARYIQCEEALSSYGLLGKHPTTKAAMASPFASLSQSFQKQANLLWYEIYDIVKANCMTRIEGDPQADMMERLLQRRESGR